jgi:hypothetical protein
MKEALIIFMILLLLLMIISVFGGSIRFTPPMQQSNFQSTRYEPFAEEEAKRRVRFTQPDEEEPVKEQYYQDQDDEMVASSPQIMETFKSKEDIMQKANNVISAITGGDAGAIEPFQTAGEFAAFS